MLTNVFPVSDSWEFLQQPMPPTLTHAGCLRLLAALDLGWQIEAPVYLRPRGDKAGERVYHFILRQPSTSALRLMTLPPSPTLEKLIRAEKLQVVASN